MSVELDPSELSFKRPFDHEVSQILSLRNPHSDQVAFKVKTTAPKQYCVRPNSGRIEPGGTVEVQVLLQAMQNDPPLDFKCRDKFLVQSVALSPDQDVTSVASIWTQIEKTAKGSIQERKIRVVFLPADGAAPEPTPSQAPNGVTDDLSSSQILSTPDPVRATPAVAAAAAAAAAPRADSDSAPSVADTARSVPAAVAEKTQATYEELKQQLAAANAQILRLRDQAQDGLRQRKGAGSSQRTESTGAGGTGNLVTATANPATSGVPLQIAALLCLVSFLLGWWLF